MRDSALLQQAQIQKLYILAGTGKMSARAGGHDPAQPTSFV
jgi:hypothetical protein